MVIWEQLLRHRETPPIDAFSEVSSRQVAVDGEKGRALGSSGYTRASYRIPLAEVIVQKHVPCTNHQCIHHLACCFDKICDKGHLGEGEFILF